MNEQFLGAGPVRDRHRLSVSALGDLTCVYMPTASKDRWRSSSSEVVNRIRHFLSGRPRVHTCFGASRRASCCRQRARLTASSG